jgi:hypothetical protein
MLMLRHQGLLEADDYITRIHTRAIGEGEGGGGGGRWRRLTSPPSVPMKPGRFCVWTKNTAPRTQTSTDQTRRRQTVRSAANGRERTGEASKASIPPLPSPALQTLPYPSTQARKPYAFWVAEPESEHRPGNGNRRRYLRFPPWVLLR